MDTATAVTVERGAAVLARDASGQLLPRRAMSGVEAGHDFPIVWVCRAEEWEDAMTNNRNPEGVPWPAEDVRPA